MDWSQFDTLRRLTGESLSIHWPYDVASIITVVSQNELRFNPFFETHIRQLDDWTVGTQVLAKFDFLTGVVSTTR